ncbi:hypothetical protein QR680_004264 [Steinernema hermaphroditum]|uniref:Uncharacterized protein n=1 Tax=Steinernema hermaphroditum TaxID=289476 RepID=A0AA39HQF7_9BILA|nr:hypothetical protein QR680_004264 [Steinernema hermaphroditum]
MERELDILWERVMAKIKPSSSGETRKYSRIDIAPENKARFGDEPPPDVKNREPQKSKAVLAAEEVIRNAKEKAIRNGRLKADGSHIPGTVEQKPKNGQDRDRHRHRRCRSRYRPRSPDRKRHKRFRTRDRQCKRHNDRDQDRDREKNRHRRDRKRF